MIVGIDPGKTGGFCVLETSQTIITAQRLTEHPNRSLRALKHYKGDITAVYMEKIHAWPKDTPTTAFGFGRYVGMVEAALDDMGFEPILVAPQTWQKGTGVYDWRRMNPGTNTKDASLALVHFHFPDLHTRNHGISDAVLIAMYGLSISHYGL